MVVIRMFCDCYGIVMFVWWNVGNVNWCELCMGQKMFVILLFCYFIGVCVVIVFLFGLGVIDGVVLYKLFVVYIIQYEDLELFVYCYCIIWLFDIYFGLSGCQVFYLLDFLCYNDLEYLYFVGDIIDGWQLKKGWYWLQVYNDVVQKILCKVCKGMQVVYIFGNYDEGVWQFCDFVFGDIQVCGEVFYMMFVGKCLWIVYGDLFDGVIQYVKWFVYFGDMFYMLIFVLNCWFNWICSWFGFQYWLLLQYLKYQVKNVVNFILQFEIVMIDEVCCCGCDGVVCGYIYKVEICDIDGVLYCNDGDWVESLFVFVEMMEGELKIVYWMVMCIVLLEIMLCKVKVVV